MCVCVCVWLAGSLYMSRHLLTAALAPTCVSADDISPSTNPGLPPVDLMIHSCCQGRGWAAKGEGERARGESEE